MGSLSDNENQASDATQRFRCNQVFHRSLTDQALPARWWCVLAERRDVGAIACVLMSDNDGRHVAKSRWWTPARHRIAALRWTAWKEEDTGPREKKRSQSYIRCRA